MSEHENGPARPIDLSEVAEEPVEKSVAAEEDAVERESGGDTAGEGRAVPEDDAQ